MLSRWPTMIVLFALGFGTACLVNTGKAQDAGGEQWFDDDFSVEDGDSLILDNHSREKGYLTVINWKPGAGVQGGSAKVANDAVTVSKDNVDSVTVYRLEPVAKYTDIFRPCDPPDFTDCPIPFPLPPFPPPPQPNFIAHPPRTD